MVAHLLDCSTMPRAVASTQVEYKSAKRIPRYIGTGWRVAPSMLVMMSFGVKETSGKATFCGYSAAPLPSC